MSGAGGSGTSSDATRTGIHAHADFAPGTVLGGRYRVDALLGIGGMGVVYRAHDLSLGVDVALKLLRPELAHREDVLERFRQELLLARQVSSPRVVRIHDIAQHDGHWLISMDYVGGESLDHKLDREGALPVEEALRIAGQIAAGLAAAHAKGVVHRDLKPANILLDAQGDAYISDFGVARSLATSGMTQGGNVVGTPDYLSPEQARGERADARSDLYALGLILHEMLAGKLPFAGGTIAEVLAQRMLRPPAPIERERDLPAWLARLVDRLLRPQPAHRLQSADDVVDAIERRALGRDLRALLPGALRVAAAGVVVAVLVAGWLWWRDGQPAPPPATAVAARPLDRLLVLPLAGSGDAALDAALSARLRDALSMQQGLAVVDGERTLLAMAQSSADDSMRVDAAKVQASVGARQALETRLQAQDGRWRVVARLHAGDKAGDELAGPHAADPLAALQAWTAMPRVLQALGLTAGPPFPPIAPAALQAHGAGLRARREGKLQDALAHFEVATAAAPTDPALWLAQAQAALDIGEYDRAADAIEQGQRAAANAPRALQQRLAAMRASSDGDPVAAAAIWRGLLQATPDDADAAINLARMQAAAGELKPAIDGLQALVQRDGNDPRIWYELGKFSILSGQAQRAVDDYLTRALVQFKRSRDLFGEAETVNALGIGYDRLGQSDDAVEQYRKAVELRHAIGNRRGEATSLRNLGNALAIAGRHDDAARYLGQARALHAELGDRAGLAAVENDLGLLAEERGNFPDALLAFRRALLAWQQLEDPLGIAQAQNDIGFAQFQLGAYNDADVYLRQAADGYAKLGDATGSIRAAQDLGLLAIARGRWGDARRQLERSLVDAERQQMQEEAAVSRRNLAELELWQGHLQAAITQAGMAEASFRGRGDARGTADAGLLQVEARLAAGDPVGAVAALAALEGTLAAAPAEQAAIAQLLRAELAAAQGRTADIAPAMQQARRLAQASGVRQLQLRIDLFAARGATAPTGALAALDAPTASLGHAGLRLGWLRQQLARAVAQGDANAAAAAYQEAANWLRAGDYRDAAALHRLGAQARRLAGDAAGARAADARAQEAGQALRKGLPATPGAGGEGE